MTSQKIRIITDSSANIPKEALVGLDVVTIPLWLIWDEESFLDGIDINPAAFYQRLRYPRLYRHHPSQRLRSSWIFTRKPGQTVMRS